MAVDERAVTNEQGAGGWEEPPTPLGASEQPCIRHKWAGGDVCQRCGITKEEARGSKNVASDTATDEPSLRASRGPRVSVGAFEAMASAVWAGLGMAIEYQPLVLNQNIKRLQDGKVVEVEGKPLKKPIANSLYMTSALAGKRIDKAFHKANPAIYKIVAQWMGKVTWTAELAPLIVAPTVVTMAATAPQLVEKFKPMLVGALIPVLVEQAKLAQQQAELMSKLEDVNADILQQAINLVNGLLGNDTAE